MNCHSYFPLLLIAFSVFSVDGTWYQNTVTVTNIDWVSSVWSSLVECVMIGYNDNNGAILRTTDGGVSWTPYSTTVKKTTDIATITLASVTYFIAVTVDGDIYVSSDSGVTFTNVIAIIASFYGVAIGKTFDHNPVNPI
jgi:hypothetical protein